LQVSRSGYYDWLKRSESKRSQEDAMLLSEITEIHQRSHGTYGSPRVHKALIDKGYRIGKKRVERLMQANDIAGRVIRVTRRQPGLKRFQAAGDNLLRNEALPTRKNRVWVADVTYLKLAGKWRYLATVMDIYSRRILGWSLSKDRTVNLTLTALKNALKLRKPEEGMIFHTDRGIEYTAYRFRDELKKYGIRQSFNRPGQCTDNAFMESFFHTLKAELIRGRRFMDENELRLALGSYINRFYNHQRMHSGLGYVPPAKFERMAV
jgi:putative transposase